MARPRQTPQPTTGENLPTASPTTDVSVHRDFDPTRSKEEAKIYSEAAEVNREHDFIKAIMAARAPVEKHVYVPPPPPPAMIEQTLLEMEAGRKRVEEFQAQEAERLAAHERHKRDKWADKGSTPVFRPPDYVPDPKKGEGVINATE